MFTRSSIESHRSRFGLAAAAVLAAALFASPTALAQEHDDEVALLVEHATRDSPAPNPQSPAVDKPSDSVLVGADVSGSEPWVDFRHGVADAAVPNCVDPRSAQHAVFVAEGLLRVPFLVGAAADGACR
jgi:hypothetical protein